MVDTHRLDNVIFIDAIPKAQVQTMLQHFNALFIGLSKSSLFKYGVSPNKLYDYLYAGKPILYAIDSSNYHPVADAQAGVDLPHENPQDLDDAIKTGITLWRERAWRNVVSIVVDRSENKKKNNKIK